MIRQGRVAATDAKTLHQRSPYAQLSFQNEYAHLVWSADLGHAVDSTAAVFLCILTNRRVAKGVGGTSTTWASEYEAR